MAIPLLPNENRAVVQKLEKEQGLPEGMLQGVAGKLSGWRNENNIVPNYLLPESERGKNETESDLMLQNVAGAKALKLNLDAFNQDPILATHAYLYGADKTEKAMKNGFSQKEVDDIADVQIRRRQALGQEITNEDIQQIAQVAGMKPSEKVVKRKRTPPPDPIAPVSLKKRSDGRYYTGHPLYDSILYIESKGNPNAVSPTGATGLFQFTTGTGKQYGLFKGGDHRKNPEANFRAMKALTRDNSKYLEKKGVPVNPTTIYLSHQLGAGGMVQIWNEMTGKGKISDKTRKNMGYNWGAGSAKEYYAKAQQKVQEAMNKTGHTDFSAGSLTGIDFSDVPATGSDTVVAEDNTQQQPEAEQQYQTPDYLARTDTAMASQQQPQYAQASDGTQSEGDSGNVFTAKAGGGGSTDGSVNPVKPDTNLNMTVSADKVNWKSLAESVFNPAENKPEPSSTVRSAIKGVVKDILG